MYVLFQSEVQLKGEVAVRNQLLHAMAEQQNLMDALTAVSLLLIWFLYVYICAYHVTYDYVHTLIAHTLIVFLTF